MRRIVCLSSLRRSLRAVSVYSIVQGQGLSHFGSSIDFFRPFSEAIQYVCGIKVVFQNFEAALDNLTQVEILGAARRWIQITQAVFRLRESVVSMSPCRDVLCKLTTAAKNYPNINVPY